MVVGAALPLAVTGLAAAQSAPSGVWTTAASGSVNLNWNTVPGAEYSIYRGTASGAEGATPIATVGGTNYSDSAVTNGKTYYYKVAASYGAKKSPESSEASCTPGSTLAGSTLAVAFAGNNQVVLKYSAVPNATFYRIFRANPYFGWQLAGSTSALTFTDTTVLNGTNYTYYVAPADAGTTGSETSTLTVTPGDAPVGRPAVAMTTASSGANDVQWTTVPGATGYVVYRSTTTGTEGAQPYALSQGAGFTDNAVVNGTTYYYTIAAIDYSGTGAVGPETSGNPGSSPLNGGAIVAVGNATSVSLNWTPVAGATGYYIIRGDGGYYNNQQLLAHPLTNTYTDTAVARNGTYYYKVLPANSSGVGPNNYTASGEVGSNSIATPTGLFAASQKSDVQLYWNPSPGAIGYAIYRSSGGTPSLYDIAYYTTGYTDANVAAGVQYTYSIAALSTDTESTQTPRITAEVNQPQIAPPLLTATSTATSVTLYWSLVGAAGSYDVFRAISINQWVAIATGVKPGAGATLATFTDTTAPLGTSSSYYVVAVGAAGVGLQSDQVSIGADNPIPPTPTGSFAVAASNGTTNVINVSVNQAPGIQSFNLYRSTAPGAEGLLPYAINVGYIYQDPNVKSGVTYYYKFTSVNADGQSGFSPECSCTIGATPLAAPTLTCYASPTQISLDWSPISGATSYDVFRAPNNGNYILYQENVTTTSLTDTDVTASQGFSYQVYAVNAKGSGSRSNTVTARAGSAVPPETTGIFAVPTATGTTVSWNSVAANAQSYNVFRSNTSGGEGQVPLVAGVQGNGIISFADTTAATGRVYYYTITAVSQDNQSVQSEEVSAKAGAPQLVAPTLQANTTTGKVNLTWTAVSGATSYNLFRTDPVLGWIIYQQKLTSTTFVDTSVISGVNYAYYVAGVSTNGQGVVSSTLSCNP